VAAPTTSLPELVGGTRNWDYRFCWLRDATFTILSLLNAGYRQEAEAWADWLLRAIAGLGSQVQPLYGVAGERRMHEYEIDWLPGYKNSRPVRIGNAAYYQLQLDVFGWAMDACTAPAAMASTSPKPAGACKRRCCATWRSFGASPTRASGRCAAIPSTSCIPRSCAGWPSTGPSRRLSASGSKGRSTTGAIPRHHPCRGLRAGLRQGCRRLRSGLWRAPSRRRALLIPIVGFLPAKDPRVLSTTAAIERELMRDGYVLRYDTDRSDDGLEGDEGAFLACSFWLADNMILQDRQADARRLFERLVSLCNDVGLLAEQYDSANGQAVGNFPQAFSHFALIDTAYNFASAEGTVREADKAKRQDRYPGIGPWNQRSGRLFTSQVQFAHVG
jgi:GH15 family glucan-1,4-alpha-glucosidase